MGILCLTCLIYCVVSKALVLDLSGWSTAGQALFLCPYNLLLILLLWAMYAAITVDPGRVPSVWGFSIDDKTKKYCVICHVFKPERTHHCSTCGRCILNMDHHWYAAPT